MKHPALELFRGMESIPSLPFHILNIIEGVSGISAMDYNIVEMIQYDPAIACRLLKTANLPLYGYSGKIYSLQQASGLLGPGAIKNIILTTTVFEKFSRDEYFLSEIDYSKLWVRSAAVAAIAQALARLIGNVESDACFTLGLISELGEIALAVNCPQALASSARVSREKKVSYVQAEMEVLGYHHGQVAAELCRSWGFPESITENLQKIDEPGPAQSSGTALLIVQAASVLAAEYGFDDGLHVSPPFSIGSVLDELQMPLSQLESWKPSLKARLDEAIVFLEQ
jgi:HD-like signal output (HDOD) protein